MTANPSKITDEFDELFGEFQSATKLPEENTNKDINDEDEEQNINIYFGEKHISKTDDFYDIEISKSFNLIKLYHSNRIIDTERVKELVKKYRVKKINFPPLIIAHIVDKEYNKDEYVLLDGQHRYNCMKQLFMDYNMDIIFTYKLYQCTGFDELEELFTDLNSHKKLPDFLPYKKTGKLVEKLEAYFKSSVSKTKYNRDYKFNPEKLKLKLDELKFFEKYDNSIDEVFKKIIELNEAIGQDYYKKKLEKKLVKHELTFLERIEKAKTNVMYLLFKDDFGWLDLLIKLL